jgi:type IV secretory pathway VirB2 component (pilin)
MKKIGRYMNRYVRSGAGKRLVTVLLTAVCFTMRAAAQQQTTTVTDFGLDSKVGMILTFLSSPWVKGVACIALIAECIGLITAGRQDPGMFKKFIPWIAGTLLFLAAGTITTAFMNGLSAASFNSVIGK